MIGLKQNSLLFIFFSLLSFPLFYFTYKFGEVNSIAHDFFQYYRLYHNWDWSNVNAPFNMRLLSSFGVFILNKLGLCYNTQTAFDIYLQYGFLKNVFFSTMLFNYLSVVFTSLIIFHLIHQKQKNNLIACVGGLIYLLGFGTIFYHLMPCVDAFSTLLFSVFLWYYFQNKKAVYFILALFILQREYILLAIILIALIDFIANKNRYYLWVCLASSICFLIYFILRKTFFYTPALSFQTDINSLKNSLLQPEVNFWQMLKQTALTLNLLFVYLGICIYKFYHKLEVNKLELIKQFALLCQITIISFAASLGNNNGRYLYMLSPLLIFQIIAELAPLVSQKQILNS